MAGLVKVVTLLDRSRIADTGKLFDAAGSIPLQEVTSSD
jgi:hypothetical protein